MADKKSKTNNFATMVSEFAKNWKTITDSAKKKQKILDQYK